jgi:hypothetical protein
VRQRRQQSAAWARSINEAEFPLDKGADVARRARAARLRRIRHLSDAPDPIEAEPD